MQLERDSEDQISLENINGMRQLISFERHRLRREKVPPDEIERMTEPMEAFLCDREQDCRDLRDHASAPSKKISAGIDMCPLSRREKSVLVLHRDGLLSYEIASQIGISIGTVDRHSEAILRKLESRTWAQAVAVAMQRGWFD
jgi:DNA-binding NarL/FixJ family response regulator